MLLGRHAQNLAPSVGAALRAHMVRLLHAAAYRTRLDGSENRLFQLSDTLTLAHFRLFMLR